MQVNVHYISLVKSYTNTSQDEFTLSNGTVLSELLDKIAEDYGKPFTQEVYDPVKKEMKASFVAMVNGVLMDQLNGVNTSSQRPRQRNFDVLNDRRLNQLPATQKT
jgi:hypothetical protein